MLNPSNSISWQEFFLLASTDESPFINHLRELTQRLQQDPPLAKAFAEIVTAEKPIALPSQIGFKLLGLGLVQIEGNSYSPMCDLYRQYFLTHLAELRP